MNYRKVQPRCLKPIRLGQSNWRTTWTDDMQFVFFATRVEHGLMESRTPGTQRMEGHEVLDSQAERGWVMSVQSFLKQNFRWTGEWTDQIFRYTQQCKVIIQKDLICAGFIVDPEVQSAHCRHWIFSDKCAQSEGPLSDEPGPIQGCF